MRPIGSRTSPAPWLVLLIIVGLVMLIWWWNHDEVAPPVTENSLADQHGVVVDAEQASADRLQPQLAQRELLSSTSETAWQLKVEVVDATAEPVAGAQVELQPTRRSAAHAAGKTNRDGICSIEVEADYMLVRAHHSGTGSSLLVAVDREEHADVPVRLLLWRPVQMTGLVLGADAQPWPGARVTLQAQDLLYGSNSPHVSPAEVVTDRSGQFAFEAAAALPGAAQLTMPGFERVHVEWVASEGQQVLLAVPGALRIEGVVLDAIGNPTAARVDLVDTVTDQAFVAQFRLGSRLELAERFALEPKRLGEHSVRAVAEDGRTATARVHITAAQPRTYVEMMLRDATPLAPERPAAESEPVLAEPFTIDVFLADGRPAKQLEVSVAQELGQGIGRVIASSGASRVSVAANRLSRRPMRLTVQDPASDQFGVIDLAAGPLPARASLTLGVRGAVALEARFRDRAAPGVTLQLWTYPEPFFSGRGKHRLEAENVPPGPALVWVKRGFEIIASKQIMVLPGALTTEQIEVELR